MQYPFGFPGRATGVEDEKWIFGIHWLRCAVGVDVIQFPVPPGIPAFFNVNLVVSPTENDDSLDLLVVFEGIINVFLERNDGAAPVCCLGTRGTGLAAILDSIFDGFSAEAPEND